MYNLRLVIEKPSHTTYDNFSAGFAPPSGMLQASGYQIPSPQDWYSGYQPTLIPSQVQQGNIHDHYPILPHVCQMMSHGKC